MTRFIRRRPGARGVTSATGHRLYDYLAGPTHTPPIGAAAGNAGGTAAQGQQRFMDGLNALRAVDALHEFEAKKQEYIGGHGLTLLRLKKEFKIASALATQLGDAKTILAEERKKYADRLFSEVAQACDRLYNKVHPNEALGFTRLKAVGNASLSPVAMFGGQEAAPQGFFE